MRRLPNGSEENKTKSRSARTIIHVTPISEIDSKWSAPRVVREIDAMLENGKYVPVIISTERVLVHDIRSIFKTKDLEDARVKIYRVPNLVEKPIYSISHTSLLSKIGYLVFNGFSQLLYLFLMMFKLLFVAIKENALVIHVHNPPDIAGVAAFVVSKIRRVPYVFEIHDSTPEVFSEEMGLSVNSFTYKILKFQERLVVKNSAALITVSDSMSTHYEDFSGPKIVIYSGWKAQAENLPMSPHCNLRSENELEGKHIILFVGKLLSSVYDLDLILHALSRIISRDSDSIFVCVGDGADRQRLQRLAEDIGVEANVLFTGFLPRSEVFEWIKACDVALLTLVDSFSNNRHAVPNKLLEYMTFGRPIVAARLPGVSEVIADRENGLLYKPGSAEDLAKCIMSAIEDSRLRASIGKNAKQDFESYYCSEKNMPKLISLYDFLSSHS